MSMAAELAAGFGALGRSIDGNLAQRQADDRLKAEHEYQQRIHDRSRSEANIDYTRGRKDKLADSTAARTLADSDAVAKRKLLIKDRGEQRIYDAKINETKHSNAIELAKVNHQSSGKSSTSAQITGFKEHIKIVTAEINGYNKKLNKLNDDKRVYEEGSPDYISIAESIVALRKKVSAAQDSRKIYLDGMDNAISGINQSSSPKSGAASKKHAKGKPDPADAEWNRGDKSDAEAKSFFDALKRWPPGYTPKSKTTVAPVSSPSKKHADIAPSKPLPLLRQNTVADARTELNNAKKTTDGGSPTKQELRNLRTAEARLKYRLKENKKSTAERNAKNAKTDSRLSKAQSDLDVAVKNYKLAMKDGSPSSKTHTRNAKVHAERKLAYLKRTLGSK